MDMNQLMQTFLAESRDLLEDMERHLLQAERGESSPDAVNAIFRAAHTIKGSGGLFDLPQLVGFTHLVESVLDLVREESVALQSELIALLLVCCDHIHALVETAADPSHADPAALAAEAEPLLAQLQTYLQGNVCGATVSDAQRSTPEKQSGYWRVNLTLFADALRFGNSPLKLIRNLRGLGSVESISTDYSKCCAAMPTARQLKTCSNSCAKTATWRSSRCPRHWTPAPRPPPSLRNRYTHRHRPLQWCRHRAPLQRLPTLRHVPMKRAPSAWTPTSSIA